MMSTTCLISLQGVNPAEPWRKTLEQDGLKGYPYPLDAMLQSGKITRKGERHVEAFTLRWGLINLLGVTFGGIHLSGPVARGGRLRPSVGNWGPRGNARFEGCNSSPSSRYHPLEPPLGASLALPGDSSYNSRGLLERLALGPRGLIVDLYV